MANLNHDNKNVAKLILNDDEYWDFHVIRGGLCSNSRGSSKLHDDSLIADVRFGEDCGEWVSSSPKYKWENAVALQQTLFNISYVGVDNGLFLFRKDRINNKEFTEIFRNNKLTIDEGDTRLRLHAVSGNTQQYEYPMSCENGVAKLNGGFYQGFFKTNCDKYQVLPSEFKGGETFNFEFTLKPCELDKESDKTLNDKYPSNKGIFFYIGTRAENKWIYRYDKDDMDGLEACNQLGMGDFVEDGDIDKDTYIIGDLLGELIEFEGYDPFDLDNDDYFGDNKYFDESLYEEDPCEWDDMSDYLVIETRKTPKLIDESQDHETLDWGCEEEPKKPSLTPFFNGCGCSVRRKPKSPSEGQETTKNQVYYVFGEDDGYLDGLNELEDYADSVDYIEEELDLSAFDYETDNGFSLSDANMYYFMTDNKFLMFDRTKSGYNVSNWVEGTEMMYYGRRSQFKGNLFILMHRGNGGYDVTSIESVKSANDNYYNPYEDIYDNALAFRITDEGAIGYRLLTKDCEKEGRDKTLLMEGYSKNGVVPMCEWSVVNIRADFSDTKMRFWFYLDGRLVFVSKFLPKINLRELDDLYEKQEGVPYSISVGGGTQGLAETIGYNYMLNPTRVYPLEKYFSGSFIGYISSFRLYTSPLERYEIEDNAKIAKQQF